MTQAQFKNEYMLLDRLSEDCKYYINYKHAGASARCLWAKDEQSQIDKMRELYDLLPVKPEWLTKEQIDYYAREMKVK